MRHEYTGRTSRRAEIPLPEEATLRTTPQRGSGRLRRPSPFVVPLFLATTEDMPCHNIHLVLPQRTSRLAARETPHANVRTETLILTRAPLAPG